MSTSDAKPSYALDNDSATANEILDCLAEILDERTMYLLDNVMDWQRPRQRCLELGAGNGSIAEFLYRLVERHGGEVVAVDIKPQHVRVSPAVRVRGLDLTRDELPAGPWDLIHARLLLAHLPQRREILIRCAEALAPGGTLLVEEWGSEGTGRVISDPGSMAAALYQYYSHALLEVFARHGNDLAWCTAVPAAMRDAGLTDVAADTNAGSWHGGAAGTRLPIAVSTELHEQLVSAGMPAEELDRLRAALTDPELIALGNLTWSTLGRKPGTCAPGDRP